MLVDLPGPMVPLVAKESPGADIQLLQRVGRSLGVHTESCRGRRAAGESLWGLTMGSLIVTAVIKHGHNGQGEGWVMGLLFF